MLHVYGNIQLLEYPSQTEEEDNMKKLLALLTALMMVLSCTLALAEEAPQAVTITSTLTIDREAANNLVSMFSQDEQQAELIDAVIGILGNLNGFGPEKAVAYEDMLPMDKWAMTRLESLVSRCLAAYERYEFHQVTYAIHNFCVVDMSNFYLDVIKDRLYCDGVDSLSRRSAQSAIYAILDGMVRLLAPILSFTADEIWQAMPHGAGDNGENVMLNDMPADHPERVLTPEEEARWAAALTLRSDVLKALEVRRADKSIGKPLDAAVTLHVSEEGEGTMALLEGLDLESLFIVSRVDTVKGSGGAVGDTAGVGVSVEPCDAPKCPRCWNRARTVGEVKAHPELCRRCAEVVG